MAWPEASHARPYQMCCSARETPIVNRNESGSEDPSEFPGLVRRIGHRVRSQPEGAQVAIYSGAIVLGIAICIAAVVYRAQIWYAFLLLLGVTLSVLALGGIAYGILHLMRQSEIRKQSQEASANAAQCTEEQRRAELLNTISRGEIQPLSDSGGLFLRNSELLWHRCPATATDRKSESHTGQLCVTSLRVLFLSADCPLEIPIGIVNAANYTENRLRLICKTAAATQEFAAHDPQLVAAYIERAVKAYHRQVDVGFENGAGRHIPQDVRTAVWQRDAGRCVECGATDYLEYDHIIPHARGGANTVDNVQLLCRRCNLKKGASI